MDRHDILDDLDAIISGDYIPEEFSAEEESQEHCRLGSINDFELEIVDRIKNSKWPVWGNRKTSDNLIKKKFKTKLLTGDEERDLGCCISLGNRADVLKERGVFNAEVSELVKKAASRAWSRMVYSNFRLVAHQVQQTTYPTTLEFDDLFQEGVIGLMTAVERYDYRKGYRFSTYAFWWIKQTIERAILNSSYPIRLPVHISQSLHQLAKAYRKISKIHGNDSVSIDSLACELGWNVSKVRQILDLSKMNYFSAESPSSSDDSLAFKYLILSNLLSPEEEVSKQISAEYVKSLLGELSERDSTVIRRRFGLGEGLDEETLEEVGDVLGVTRERIRQMQVEALKKLRKKIERDTFLY